MLLFYVLELYITFLRECGFDLMVDVLTMRAVVNKKLEIFGGNQYKPLVSIKDVAQLIYKKESYDVTFYNKEKTVMEEFQL